MTGSTDVDDLQRIVSDMIEDLRARGAVPGVAVGDPAPTFTLPNAVGEPVDLTERLATGPVVIVFYRGAWCPICNTHLRSFQAGLDSIRARGASLLAISPQTPDDSLPFAERLELGFDVLSDVDQAVISEWNLRFPLPDALRDVYRTFDMDLEVHNADGSWYLPVPATFVLDRGGVVRARHVDPNYRARMSLDDVLVELDALTADEE